MGDFTAKLELPEFIPKEMILGKYVLDSEVRKIGIIKDWTYSTDGKIKMIVKTRNLKNKTTIILIPFSHIERVGQFVLLKTKVIEFMQKKSPKHSSQKNEVKKATVKK